MSKYLRFDHETFPDRACLLAALAALGYPQSQLEEGFDLPLYGYLGDMRPERAAIVLRRRHVGPHANDIGFSSTAAGYVPIISEYDQQTFQNGRFLPRLKVAYGEAVAQRLASRLCGTVRRHVEGGKIVITIRTG